MTSPDLEHRRLPRILNPFETWGFGLTGLLVWVIAIPVIHGFVGSASLYIWLPGSLLASLVCWQVRALAKKYPGVSGGIPGYVALLLPDRPWLATYAGLGYYLGWCASFVWIGYAIVETLQSAFGSVWLTELTVPVILALSLITYGVGFSSTRILSILQNLFVWATVGTLLLFTVAGTGYLLRADTLSFWAGWPVWSGLDWVVTMSFALVNVLYMEVGATMMADARRPRRTADFLRVPAVLMPVLFVGGGWIFGRLAQESGGVGVAGLISVFTLVFGPVGSVLVILLVLLTGLLTLNSAVVMLPRTLFEMSKKGLLHPAYANVNQRGILTNGLGATLLVTFGLTIFGVRALYIAAGFGYVAAYAIFHFALWKNRATESVPGGSWTALALGGFEAGIMLAGAWLSSPTITAFGAILPVGLILLDRISRRLPVRKWSVPWPRLFSRYDVEYNQILTNTFVTGMAVTIVVSGLAGVTSLNTEFLVLFGLVSFVLLVFMATAVAGWTTIPQIDALQEASEKLEKANRELTVDLEKRKKLEAKLARNLRRDDLTRLGNRRLLEDCLGLLLVQNRKDYALVFLDLDRFKVVNDGLGHVVGDDVLKAVARRLRRVVGRKSSTTIVRLGGDEFVVLFERVQHTKDIMGCVQKILEAFEEPLTVGEGKITTTVSAGVVFGERRYDHFEQLLRDADIAMYRSKLNGRNRATVFTDLMRTQAQQTHLMEVALRHALEEKNFVLRYQPIVDSRSNEACGYECLLRMKGGQGELISPDSFVDIAEENGLIVPITWWVLDQALRDLRDWRAAGCECYVSINMSNRTLGQIDLKDRVAEALAKYNLTPDCLNFEVLESAIVNDVSVVQKNLQLLHNFGVKISIDDFGIGYSNLSRLHEMPIDTLKIDRTYVQNLQGHGANIIQTIMDLAQNMGFKVVVEGVEEDCEREQLQGMDCAMMQGYLYAKPMPAVDVVEFTRNLPVVPVLERQRR